jgi:thiol:disulfide interchange protein
MDKTTLANELVHEKLKHLVKLKFRAERPNSKEIKEVLDYFGVMGLPTFLILEPMGGHK